MKDRILPGTATWARYPAQDAYFGKAGPKGIAHYGKIEGCYKIPGADLGRVELIGYHAVKVGSAYAYVRKGR